MRQVVATLSSIFIFTLISTCQGARPEDEDDFEVAQPVPMALLDPEHFAHNAEVLNQTGNNAGYDEAKADECNSNFDPMDTGLVQEGESSSQQIYRDEVPKNLCIATSIMTTPGVAAGEMQKLLRAMLSLTSNIFGKNGFFATGMKDTQKRKTLFKIPRSDHEWGKASYVQVVIVNEGKNPDDRKQYRVNLYFPATDPNLGEPTAFSLNTTFDFSPLPEDENFADVSLRYTQRELGSEKVQHITAQYNTKSLEFKVDFGTTPIDPQLPAKTSLSWRVQNELLTITGAHIWKNGKSQRESKSLSLPNFYSPIDNDAVLYQSLSKIVASTDKAESVQRLAFLPAVNENTTPDFANGSVWDNSNAGYYSEVLAFLVGLLRNPAITPQCSSLKSLVTAALNQHNKAIPSGISNIPEDNLCSTNTNATRQQVETLVIESCRLIDLRQIMNLDYGGVKKQKKVSLCTKLAEGLYLANPQFLFTTTFKNNIRGRTPLVIWTTGAPSVAVTELLAQSTPSDPEFAYLSEQLKSEISSVNVLDLQNLEWPEVESRPSEFFKGALGAL